MKANYALHRAYTYTHILAIYIKKYIFFWNRGEQKNQQLKKIRSMNLQCACNLVPNLFVISLNIMKIFH